MSGSRLTRRVTVEGGKKLPDAAAVPSSSGGSSSAPAQRRLSVFERLGPGGVDRSKPRESYPVERCRNWLREGRCQFGPKCKFLHGPFTDPTKRTKTVRSVVSKDRSSDKEEDHHSRTRSVDSLEAAEDEELQLTAPVKKKKHKSAEGSQLKKTSKRQRAEQDGLEGEDREGEERKRKKKAKKKRELSPVVITKPCSPQKQETWPDWEEDKYETQERGNGSELEWEEQGELDFQRQLALEKRRQDLQRQLAQMDEEEAALDDPDTGGRISKKVLVVHSRLHPEASSLSPADEAVSSQTAIKKKKKKVDPDARRAKHKSSNSKEKKHKSPRLSAGSVEHETLEVSEAAAAKGKSNKHLTPREEEDGHLRESRAVERTKRITKSHEKPKEEREGKNVSRDQYRSPPPAPEAGARQIPKTPPRSDVTKEPTDRTTHGQVESKNKTDRTRRKAALLPHEAHAVHLRHDPGGERTRRSRESPGDAPRRAAREIQETSEEMHKQRREKTRKVSPGEGRSKEDHEETRRVQETPPESRGRSWRHVEGASGVLGPRTPSPQYSPNRGPRTPPSPDGPEERHHHGEDSRTSKHGPHTPPGEPSIEDERYVREEGRSRGDRSPPRHHRGPRTPPPDNDTFLSPRDTPRWTKEEAQDFRGEHAAVDRRGDHRGESHTVRPGGADESTRERSRGEVDPRRRARDSDPHQKARAHDGRPREELRDVEYQRRHDEREDEHQKARPRAEPRDDDSHRKRDERDDEFSRGRGREEREVGYGRERARDLPRRQLDGGGERRWEGRDRDTRFPPQQDSRSRDKSGERGRDRDPRYAPSGPDLHRRQSSPPPPPPPGGRRSPPHGMSRGRGRPGQPRFDERRRSLSPGRRDEGFRGPPREPSYGRGREMARGYSGPGDRRPMENRRRGSPPPRQFQDRDRGGPRPREPLPGRGRGIRGFPDRPRPPGDRYREPPREGGASWERRPEREHPRDRGRPHDESRDRERRPHGEHSPARGPRNWEEKRGSPGRGPSPSRERRTAHDQERESKERNVEHGRRSADEEEWEYEEGDEKQARKRPREQPSPVSSSESAVETKKARSVSPDIQAIEEKKVEETKGNTPETTEPTKAAPGKAGKKVKKKKEAKKEAERTGETPATPETPAPVDTTAADDTTLKTETTPAADGGVKYEKKHKKEKGKTKEKEKGAKKKKKAVVAPAEVPEVTPKPAETSSEIPSEHTGEQISPAEVEPTVKAPKKRKHGTEGEGAKGKEGEKPTKKKKKKKHQQEVVFQPWADLEEREAEERKKIPGKEDKDSADQESAGQARAEMTLQMEQTGSTSAVTENSAAAKRVDEVFSDWSDDDSPLGGDGWFNENKSEEPAEKPAAQRSASAQACAAIPSQTPAFDDVYDPISDDELDAMLEEEDAEEWAGSAKTPAPMSVEEVDWSALVTSHSSTNKTEGHEPGAHLKRFAPGQVFSRIGISPTLAGPRLTKLVQQTCAQAGTAVFDSADSSESNDLQEAAEETQTRKSAGALVAAAAARRRERETLFTDVGPCRRALCARRDLAIRKKLRRVSSKFVAKLNMFSATPTTPVDSDLFLMSIALYKHEAQAADVQLVSSKVGSVLAST